MIRVCDGDFAAQFVTDLRPRICAGMFVFEYRQLYET